MQHQIRKGQRGPLPRSSAETCRIAGAVSAAWWVGEESGSAWTRRSFDMSALGLVRESSRRLSHERASGRTLGRGWRRGEALLCSDRIAGFTRGPPPGDRRARARSGAETPFGANPMASRGGPSVSKPGGLARGGRTNGRRASGQLRWGSVVLLRVAGQSCDHPHQRKGTIPTRNSEAPSPTMHGSNRESSIQPLRPRLVKQQQLSRRALQCIRQLLDFVSSVQVRTLYSVPVVALAREAMQLIRLPRPNRSYPQEERVRLS